MNPRPDRNTHATAGAAAQPVGRNARHVASRAARRMSLILRTLLRPGPHQTELITEDGEQSYRPIDLKLIRRLLQFLWPYRYRYALGVFVGMVMILLDLQSPRFVGWIVNYTTNYVSGQISPAPSQQQAMTRVAGIVGLWACLLGTTLLLERWIILIMTDAGERVQFDIRRALFAHLQRLSMSFYDKTKFGRIISRCTSDVNSLREVNVWGIHTVVQNTLMICFAAGMLLATQWRLFLAVAWLSPVLFVLNRAYRRKAAIMHQRVREGYTKVATNLAENITGVRVVTAFDRQSWNLGVFNVLQYNNTENNLRAARVNGVYLPLLGFMGFCGRAIILLYGGYLVASGRIDRTIGVGSVVTAFLYWDRFMGPTLNFGNFYNQLMAAMAGGERIMALLDLKPEVADLPHAKPLPPIVGHVRFEHVTFGYDPNRPVLHDVDFEAQPGQMIALVGPTGSGKSSIISLIARFYQPQKGRVLVDGHDLRYVTGDSLHRQMGLVLQSNYLFTGTVMENIRYARPEATEQQVIDAAKALGTYDAIIGMQDGFNTQVGERGANVSLGQRQLICFTRAFLADPRIFMLDEATSSVDTATEQIIQRSLEKLLENRTTFVVAHRLSTIQRADCILVIDNGRIIERGTHWTLLEKDGKYASLYEQFLMHTEAHTRN
ncbi:MAG: ABC transporter ATP-binding protein [Phycisphaerae bacterium]